MTSNHKIRSLGVHTRFDSEALAMDCQKALTVFASQCLPRIMDEVFSSRSSPGLVRRFDRVELDLGEISRDEFPDGIEERLRKKLADFLDDHPVLSEPVLSAGSSRQLPSGLAEEEAILHFIENGILPWHGSFSNAGDMMASLEKRLGTGAAHFINRLKDAPDMKTMVKRLTRQFPEAIIEKILEAVAPGRGRATREVIRRLDAFYAAGTVRKVGGKAGKDPGSGADTVQEIKDHVWEHILLMTLGGRGISSKLLELKLPQHFSPEARHEISRIFRHLSGSNAIASAGTTPHHPDTWPIHPSFWAEKIQAALRKSGRKDGRGAEPDLPRIWGEVILLCFESLADDIQVKLETALKSSPVPVSVQHEDTEGEWESRQVITDYSSNNSHGLVWSINTEAQPTTKHESKSVTYWNFDINCPGKQAPGDQTFSSAKGKPVKKSSGKEVVNGEDESDNGVRAKIGNATLRNKITLDSGLLDEAVLSPMVQKDEAPESQALFHSGVGRSFVRSKETGYKIYLQWIQSLLDCLGAMADKDASPMSPCLTGEALSVMGDMIFEAAVSTPEPEVFLAELSSMVAGQVTGEKSSSKATGRVSVKELTGKFLYGVDPLTGKVHEGDKPDEPVSAFSQGFAGKALENLRMGTLWQILLSETWISILTSGLSPGFFGPACSSENKASYLSVVDSVLSLAPEKREPFAIRILFRFAERMQLPITPFPDHPGSEAQSGTANGPKAVKTIFQASETDGDSGPALGQALNSIQADRSLPDPAQEAGHDGLGPDHSISNSLEKWRALLRNPVVQKNIRSTHNMEEVWDVIQAILHWKIQEIGLESVREKFKSDACAQPRESPGDKQDDGRDSLADKLSLILKSGPDPKDFLLRVLTGLVSGDPHQEHGSGEKPTSYAPRSRKLGNPPAEKHLEQVGGALSTCKPSGDQRVTAVETHPAAASRKWGRGSEPVFVENAGMVLAGPYLPMLFRKLDLLDNREFKSRYAAEKAVHILEYMVTGEQSAPEFRLVLNKLLCGMEADRPIHQLFMLEKAETDLTRELILSMIAHWKALGKTSVEGFRQSFLTREGRLEANEDTWNLVVAPKPFDMLLDRIPWTFSPIRLPWMDQGLHVRWR